MKKSILTAIGMALVLFIYGYFASTAGHDHSSHEKQHVEEGHGNQSHGDHDHDH